MKTHIMIVDDDAANLRTAGHILSKNQMRVTALESGAAMLERIQKDDLPDLILLDIKMPEIDGFESLSLLRLREKELGIEEIPVIFLTADEAPDTERMGFEAGVADYIRKPFDPDILIRRVRNIVSKEQRLSTLRSEADTDKLTGFLNKAAAARVMTALCSSDLGCLMVVDLDSFKLVNDLYGHKTGDNILIYFAAILRSAVPEGSTIKYQSTNLAKEASQLQQLSSSANILLIGIAVFTAYRSAMKGRLSKSPLVLKETEETVSPVPDAQKWLEKEGTAVTALRPAGFVEISGVRLNASASGEFLEKGTPVIVTGAEGSHLVVRKI